MSDDTLQNFAIVTTLLGCPCCGCLIPGLIVLCLAGSHRLWQRGEEDSVDQVALQALFYAAIVLLACTGCVTITSAVSMASYASDDELQREAKRARAGGESYASHAFWHRVYQAASCALFTCPITLTICFLGAISSWAAVGDGHPVGAVCGVAAGILACLASPWIIFIVRVVQTELTNPGLDLLQGAANAIDDSIESALRTGSLRLLSIAWLLANPGLETLPRRQDLPEEAFVSSEEAVSMHQEGRVYVLSYGWLQAGCPDPHGQYLQAVRRFLEALGSRAETTRTTRAETAASTRAAETCGLFWDYSCLPQKPRTDAEDKEFGELLKLMGNLYGSMWRTTVLQHKNVPPPPLGGGQYNARPYDERGWCSFEQGAALLAAGHRKKADQVRLGRRQPKLIDISGPTLCLLDRPEPPALAELEQHMATTSFTGSGDREKVMAMLKDFNALLMVAASVGCGKQAVAAARRKDERGGLMSMFGRERAAVVPTPESPTGNPEDV